MKKQRWKLFIDGVFTWEYDTLNSLILALGGKYGAMGYNKMYAEGKINIKKNSVWVKTK